MILDEKEISQYKTDILAELTDIRAIRTYTIHGMSKQTLIQLLTKIQKNSDRLQYMVSRLAHNESALAIKNGKKAEQLYFDSVSVIHAQQRQIEQQNTYIEQLKKELQAASVPIPAKTVSQKVGRKTVWTDERLEKIRQAKRASGGSIRQLAKEFKCSSNIVMKALKASQ